MGQFSCELTQQSFIDLGETGRGRQIESLTKDISNLYFQEEIEYSELCSRFSDIAKTKEELFIIGGFAEAVRAEKEKNDIMQMIMSGNIEGLFEDDEEDEDEH